MCMGSGIRYTIHVHFIHRLDLPSQHNVASRPDVSQTGICMAKNVEALFLSQVRFPRNVGMRNETILHIVLSFKFIALVSM